jgi:glycosyltransferase involved in cell wall biosynthesis
MFLRRRALGRIAFNMRPARGPWGGSSPFVVQLKRYLKARGYEVSFDLRKKVDVIVLIDPRDDLQLKSFGMEEIKAYKKTNPKVKVLHRVNECDQRKDTKFMDELLKDANEVADHTVFIASWLLEYHSERWFDKDKSHSVIYNGADPTVFHPIGSAIYDHRESFRLVTHHWSDNVLKGFDEYYKIDQAIARGELKGVELLIVGRWPSEIKWESARLFSPAQGKKLADILRSSHAYVTASRWEPCGMHHVEGAQCGLPLLYHKDGGGIVEAGERYGLCFGDDDYIDAINMLRDDYDRYRNLVLNNSPCGDYMVMEYTNRIQSLIAKS